MSRRWLLSLLCLSLGALFFVQSTRARYDLRVDEAKTKLKFLSPSRREAPPPNNFCPPHASAVSSRKPYSGNRNSPPISKVERNSTSNSPITSRPGKWQS